MRLARRNEPNVRAMMSCTTLSRLRLSDTIATKFLSPQIALPTKFNVRDGTPYGDNIHSARYWCWVTNKWRRNRMRGFGATREL